MNILSEINKLASTAPKQLIDDAEQSYSREIDRLVEQVLQQNHYKIMLLAGPSGSGKTTSAHILRDRFAKAGLHAAVISLDNFYLSSAEMPRLENGDPDYESVYSLDIPEIHRCFSDIITFGTAEMPTFNFLTRKRDDQPLTVDIRDHGILIVEGLHALNPVLTDNLRSDDLFRIYISVNCSVVDDSGSVILTSRQMRLTRRMSRDYIYRNSTAEATLKLWTSVVRGEEKYLYCFKNTADTKLITFHGFEPCIFRSIISNLLEGLTPMVENYSYVMRIKEALEQFVPLPLDLVPQSSLIREFIEGGTYENTK